MFLSTSPGLTTMADIVESHGERSRTMTLPETKTGKYDAFPEHTFECLSFYNNYVTAGFLYLEEAI